MEYEILQGNTYLQEHHQVLVRTGWKKSEGYDSAPKMRNKLTRCVYVFSQSKKEAIEFLLESWLLVHFSVTVINFLC